MDGTCLRQNGAQPGAEERSCRCEVTSNLGTTWRFLSDLKTVGLRVAPVSRPEISAALYSRTVVAHLLGISKLPAHCSTPILTGLPSNDRPCSNGPSFDRSSSVHCVTRRVSSPSGAALTRDLPVTAFVCIDAQHHLLAPARSDHCLAVTPRTEMFILLAALSSEYGVSHRWIIGTGSLAPAATLLARLFRCFVLAFTWVRALLPGSVKIAPVDNSSAFADHVGSDFRGQNTEASPYPS